MIPRYSRPEMTAIWAAENKFRIWFEIEAHASDAQAALGVIPKEAAKAIWERGAFQIERIDEIEKETKHDVIAYINNVSNYIGDSAKYFHHGITSSDIIDTSFSVQLKQSAEIIINQLSSLLKTLKNSLLNSKITFLSVIFFVKVINLSYFYVETIS